MKRLLLLLLAACFACAWSCQGAPTVITREAFQGVGTLTAAAPGNLGTVNAGSFFKRPVGPRLTSDTSAQGRGWSADAQGQTALQQTLTLPAAVSGAGSSPTGTQPILSVRWWVYLGAPLSDGVYGKTLFNCQPDQPLLGVSLAVSDGLTIDFSAYTAVTTPTTQPYAFTVGVWTECQVVFQQLPGQYYDYRVSFLVRNVGSTAWTEVGAWPDNRVYANAGGVQVGIFGPGSTAARARYGMPGLYTLDAWSDRLAPTPGVVDPPPGPFQWYANAATGNDSNDGTTPATAWASAAKIDAESAGLGMIPTTAGYAAGDTLTIDTTTANLVLGTASLDLNTRGLNVVQLGGGLTGTGEIQAWTALPASQWSLVSGAAKTYQQTLTEANPSCVLWEDDQWLSHPTGTSLSAVLPSLESVPGSFWTDGVTMYVHPFGDTDPASDGKNYTRSYHRGAPYGAAAVNCFVPDLHLNGLRVRKTCLADMATDDPVAAYCYQTSLGAGGNCLLENCYGGYGSKHIFGFTDDDLNRHYTTNNCQAEQGSPYTGAGGQTPWVDYADNPGSNGTATHVYTACTTAANSGLIGSTAGQDRSDIPAWITHNRGGAAQFAEIDFVDCNLAGNIGGGNVLTTLRYTGGSCDGAQIDSTQAYFTGVFSTQPLAATDGGSMTALNCILPISFLNGGFAYPVNGTNSYEGCTIDCRATDSNTTGVSMFVRTGPLDFHWRNNLFLGSSSILMEILAGAAETDTLAFDHNAYSPGTGVIVGDYTDGTVAVDLTLAQWQLLGEDTGSFAVVDPMIDGRYVPALASPLTDAGADLGDIQDYSGRTFPHRRTIGALEPLTTFARWQAANFTAGELGLPQVSGPGADPDGDGLSNLLEYALHTNPRAPDAAAPTTLGVQTLGGQSYLTLRFTQLNASADLLYLPQVSSDLLTWQSGPGQTVPLASVDNGDGTSTVTVRDALPMGTGPRRFLRLQVSLQGATTTFGRWQAANFTAGELGLPQVSGPGADPDGDGLSNLLEYALHTNPRAPDAAAPTTLGVQTLGGQPYLTLRFTQLNASADLLYLPQVSSDLLTWQSGPGQTVPLASVDNGDGTSTVTVRDALPMGTGPRRFLRLQVSLQGTN